MSDQLTEQQQSRPSMGVHPTLWLGLLLPPIVWAVQMQLNYWAVRGACARGDNVRLYAVTLIALLIIVLSGLVAWVGANRITGDQRFEQAGVITNQKFMLALALFGTGIFILAVAAQGIAAIVIHPCQL
jgi:hypothetical protein